MRRLIFGSLSFFLLAPIAAHPVRAETPSWDSSNPSALDTPSPNNTGLPSLNPSDSSNPSTLNAASPNSKVGPFDLVGLAQQGYLENYGIPSHQALLTAYRSGEISAEDVVKSGIQANRLSSDVLNNSDYIAVVDSYLDSISRGK